MPTAEVQEIMVMYWQTELFSSCFSRVVGYDDSAEAQIQWKELPVK